MATPDLKKVREVFDVAAELAPAERAALLDQICGKDATLRGEVERLLRAYDQAGEFIEQPALAIFDSSASDHPTKELTVEMVGRRIGQYRVVRELGRGGMGVVFLAERTDGEFHKLVAIKLLPPDAEESAVQRFRRERQILADLEHPNIARLIDGGTLDGQPYVVMEFVEGRSLREVLEGVLPLEKIPAIARQLCAGLEAAHQRGIVHRDIKPENLIVAEHEGEIHLKILDFGVAKLQHPTGSGTVLKTHTGLIVGTVSYMSPEQAAGVGGEQIDARSDIYSAGMVLYEMLTGRPAFTGDSALSILYKHQHTPPVPPHRLPAGAKIPRAVSRVVLKALAKDRAARQPSARELAEELEQAFLYNRSPSGKHHWWKVTAVVTALLVIGLGVWGMTKWRAVSPSAPSDSFKSSLASSSSNLSVRLQYRQFKTDDSGKQTLMIENDVVLPGDKVHFEVRMPFAGDCYLFYEVHEGEMVWANPDLNHRPQHGQAGEQLRVPPTDGILYAQDTPRKQFFLAVYVPDSVHWSLENVVPFTEIKLEEDVVPYATIKKQFAAGLAEFLNSEAIRLTFSAPTADGIYFAAEDAGSASRRLFFHRMTIWHRLKITNSK